MCVVCDEPETCDRAAAVGPPLISLVGAHGRRLAGLQSIAIKPRTHRSAVVQAWTYRPSLLVWGRRGLPRGQSSRPVRTAEAILFRTQPIRCDSPPRSGRR
jgi:hypothetical protein